MRGEGEDDFARSDVPSVIRVLRDQGYKPLPNSPLNSVLLGEDATYDNLKGVVDSYVHLVPDGDPMLLLYYSGHGEVDPVSHDLTLYESGELTTKHSFSLKDITTVRLNVEENQLVNVIGEFGVCIGNLKSA